MDSHLKNVILSAPDNRRRRKRRGKKIPQNQRKTVEVVKKEIIRTMERKRVAKYLDTALLNQTATSTVGFLNLSLVPQGFQDGQRVADTIITFRLDIRFYAYVNQADTDFTDYVRTSFFLWKPNTAVYPPVAVSIFQNTTTFTVLSPFSFETRDNYSILRDCTYTLSGYVGVPTSASIVNYTDSISLENHRIAYGVGVTAGTGHLFFADYSDSLTTPHPLYSIVTRLWYYDED